ncbi:AGD2-like defense response protein 1 isoform 1 [Hibiscus syriacus]|uniref:AGD2-like defense response protein 1 isoform 1 n=1 Tax=Hibiscus syriacus TaxID=106335 RepID=A0A6A2YC69_HIBSY|nr:AGD2-like defense response protein 1 isoform 1 [Hibiscus syriacus]
MDWVKSKSSNDSSTGSIRLAVNSKGWCEPLDVSQDGTCKRQLSSSGFEENPRLISSLPDEISYQILARVPRINYLNARLVSRAWKAAITSTELFNKRKELGTTEEWLYILTKVWLVSGCGMLSDPALKLQMLLGLVLGGRMHLRECRFVDVQWVLLMAASVLGGFSRASALRCVWQYNPVLNSWSEVSSMLTVRAYCKTAILNDRLYAIGGVTRGHGGLTPLQSAEVLNPRTGVWSQIPSMPFSKAQVLPTAFLADILKPIATGLTTYRGRLFMPQSLYCWPFFVDVGGEVYDPDVNSWVEMPAGMGDGWPARQGGTKLSIAVDGELYALDLSNFPESVKIKIHVITKDGNSISILQADLQSHVSSPSASSSDSYADAHPESAGPATAIKTVLWRVVATRTKDLIIQEANFSLVSLFNVKKFY